MRIYFPLQFISQASAHQLFDAVRRFEPHQLKEPCIDRYVYKQVRNRHFVAIGVEATCAL